MRNRVCSKHGRYRPVPCHSARVIAAVDVHYAGGGAVAACVAFRDWPDAEPAWERTVRVAEVAAYEPGAFYRRELPPLLEVLAGQPFDAVLIDGYVWLGEGRKGLGAWVHEALGKPVIGVAKTAFRGAPAIEVLRGGSRRPLFVTAAGHDATATAEGVGRMHGAHRIPTLLKRVDRLCRGTADATG